MAGSGPTVDVSLIDEEYEDTDGLAEAMDAWGRLFSLGKGLKGIDLIKDEYTFGRSDDSDYCFERMGGRENTQFRTFSNLHFRIYKEVNKSNSNKFIVFIEDKSTNGTFVNGEKLGKNKKQVLNNDDEIGLSFKKNKVFVFNDKSVSEKNEKLPQAFNDTYTMSKLLGRGACGEVRLAFNRDTCNRYAVKIISKKTFSVGPQLGRQAMEEVTIIKSIQHACIIRVEDLFETADTLYIVLELVEGGELFDRVINVGKFSDRIAKLLFYQMLMAVKYLHDRGITHRDLKPENILLSSDAEETLIKVTDFGLSKFVGEQSLMKTLCGTPSYLAPEVIKSAGLGGYSKAVDCWSLGVILYIMLGGYPPFSDEIKEYSLHDQICNARYSFPEDYWKDVSKDAKDLISRLLTIDPQQRITTNEAVNHPWMNDADVIATAEELMSAVDLPPEDEVAEALSELKESRKRSYPDDDEDCINNSKKSNLDATSVGEDGQQQNDHYSTTTELVSATSVASTITNRSHSNDDDTHDSTDE